MVCALIRFKEELMKKKLHLLLAVLMGLSIISCGHDDDDNDDTPEQEVDTTGSNGTTGTTGTTGTSTTCLTTRQRDNIRTFLIRASDLRTFNGTGTEIIREDDGTQTTTQVTAVIDYQQANENTWIVNAGICSQGMNPICQERQTVISFRNGCLNANGAKASNLSTSDSSLSYRYFDTRFVRERASLATDKLQYSQTETKNGITVRRLMIREN